MEFRELKYITTIADCGSFTEAANLLYVSQPSLSHMVARVEQRLGVRLFDRSRMPLVPTYAGEVYLRYAEEILSAGQRMENELFDIAQVKKGRLRIGIPYERATDMLPKIIPRFREEYPGIQLEISDASGAKLMELLERGRIDFAVMPLYENRPDMESVLIYEEELLLSAVPEMIAPDDFLNGTENIIDVAKLHDKPFIFQKDGKAIRVAIDLLLNSFRVKPPIVQIVSGNMVAYGLSCSGMGVAIIPEITVRLAGRNAQGRLFRLGSTAPVFWEIRVVYRKNVYLGEAERRFIEIMQEIFGSTQKELGPLT